MLVRKNILYNHSLKFFTCNRSLLDVLDNNFKGVYATNRLNLRFLVFPDFLDAPVAK